ncbi:MAG: glucose-6-phosphate 1-epimerase [Cellvibrionaceae bacterium]|jgi:glucose-6-phosphate 1-epimerase
MAEKIQALYQSYGELEGVSIECQKELIAIGITNKCARAEIFLQGAQVTGYQRHGEAPILFLSKDCQFKQGSPLRGGIPICWPWFGDLNKNNPELKGQFSSSFCEAAPAHGFVRDIDWDVKNIRIVDDKETLVTLKCDVPLDNAFGWPFSACLVYEVSVGETLKAALSVKNSGDNNFIFSAALHSYFKVDSIINTKITSLNKVFYINALKGWSKCQQHDDVVFNQEVDRIYLFPSSDHGSSGHSIDLKDTRRSLNIESGGSASAIVWNPWIEKSKRLTQFSDDEYKKMVCIETANVADDMVMLAPNQEHVLSVKIS